MAVDPMFRLSNFDSYTHDRVWWSHSAKLMTWFLLILADLMCKDPNVDGWTRTNTLFVYFLCGKTHHVSWLSCSSMSIFLDQSRSYEKLVLSDWPQDEALVTWSPRWGNLSDFPDWMGIWVIFRWFCLGFFSWGYKLTKLRLLTVARGITYPYRN